MEETNNILSGYENSKCVHYSESTTLPNTFYYDEIHKKSIPGVLKANRYVNGRLLQTYSEQDSHVGVIAATRLGKTTSYVIPTILSFARQTIKKSMIISDPKGEVYCYTAETLRAEGYRVVLLNFRDYLHSECWNMLTPTFRKYKNCEKIIDEVSVVETENGQRNKFRGRIYDTQPELDEDIERAQNLLLGEVGDDIDKIAMLFIKSTKKDDDYWDNSARDLLKAFLWAMLEDSSPTNDRSPITEDTFSFSTILTIVSTFKDDDGTYYNDGGYFTRRNENSRAYALAKNTLIENAHTTRKCVMGTFMSKLSIFNEVAMRLITSCNSFEISEITNGPIAIFINYRDELKVHYQVISLFIRDVYRFLIAQADSKTNKKLDVPVYFILDEFGNFPRIDDFDSTISACGGRNIFFILIIQSYAQLDNVYGTKTAEIIRDNLNVCIFLGSNNYATLEKFSQECGQYTRISPLSALNGRETDIENFHIETIPLVPKSTLSYLTPGECIVSETNCGYVMFSKLERFFMCDEFKNLPMTSEKEYACSVNPFDKRYTYIVKKTLKKRRSLFDYELE